MQEIRFHGRGGQGAVIGSEVLAQAFFIEGKYVQAFPAFGVERRGAPVMSFCRVDNSPIYLRNQIYRPDHIVVLDASILGLSNVVDGLKGNGTVLINCFQQADSLRGFFGGDFQVYIVDASSIAVANRLGSASNPIVNTAILGAFSKATGLVGIDAVCQAIEEHVPVNKEANRQAAFAAFNQVVRM